MRFYEAMQVFGDNKPPKGLTEVEHKKLSHDDSLTIYSAPTNLKFFSLRTKQKYPAELQYRKHLSYPLGKDDPDAFEHVFWDKSYKIPLDDEYGVFAISTNGKLKFSTKGYKNWNIYVYYLENGKENLHNHYPNKTIKTEKKALDLLFKEVIPTVQTRQALGWDKEKIVQKSLN